MSKMNMETSTKLSLLKFLPMQYSFIINLS